MNSENVVKQLRMLWRTDRIGNLAYVSNQSLQGVIARLHLGSLGRIVWVLAVVARPLRLPSSSRPLRARSTRSTPPLTMQESARLNTGQTRRSTMSTTGWPSSPPGVASA